MGSFDRLRAGTGWMAAVAACALVASPAVGGRASATTMPGVRADQLPAELGAGPSSGPVVSPDQARSVVEALWPLRERALAGDDARTTRLLEDGVAREFDEAVITDNLARHLAPLARVRTHGAVVVFVARQLQYPAEFLAEVATSLYSTAPAQGSAGGAPYVEMMVMTRRDASSRWMLSLDTGYASAALEQPAAGPDGFDGDPAQPGWVDPAGVHPMLAAYWQHWVDNGSAPPDSPFLAGYWTDQHGAQIGQVRQDGLSPRCGCVVHAEYRAEPGADGIEQFDVVPTFGGPPRDLVCSTVRVTVVNVPLPGDLLLQDSARGNWGGWLRPGLYRSITTDTLRQSCILTGSSRSAGLAVVGGNGDVVRVTGARVAGPSLNSKTAGDRLSSAVETALALLAFWGLGVVSGVVVLVVIATSSHRSGRDEMIKQYTAATTPEEDAEYAAWERIRDAAAADMLGRPREED